MSSNHSHDPAASSTSAQQARSGRRRRTRRTFPVTIVRPATITTPPLTAGQRERRQAAYRLGRELTEAARQARHPLVDETILSTPLNVIPEALDILATAPRIAAAPPPADLRVGRNLRGEPVAVVLHSDRWSLVVRPPVAVAGHRPPESCVFLQGYGKYFGMSYAVFCFDDDPSALGMSWTEMINRVVARTA
ncbi:hypothetical protein AB0D32_03630 [Micromonospora sp. NPDC048170]|uniref:hypothetical protein n=1 Tax=Micromonospora sp. NPDC048170 TaxID=3154819 RepID=UPI0033FD872E